MKIVVPSCLKAVVVGLTLVAVVGANGVVDDCSSLPVSQCRSTVGCLWTSNRVCAAFNNRCDGLGTKKCFNTGGCKIIPGSNTCVLDPNPPSCKVLGEVIEFQGTATDEESGILAVVLLEGSENVILNVDPFTPGDTTVSLSAARANDDLPARGMIQVFDQSGLTCEFSVALEPFDFELYEEQIAYPSTLHTQLFSTKSRSDNPIYFTVVELPEEPGIYEAMNEDETPFFIQITSIVVASGDFEQDTILQDDSVSEEIKALEASVVSFAFRGFFRSDDIGIEVVALAYTFEGIEPAGGSNIAVIYNPDDFFGVTGPSDTTELEPVDFPDPLPVDVRRRLFEQGGESPFKLTSTNVVNRMPYPRHSDGELWKIGTMPEAVLVPRGRARELQAESCGNALQEAIDAANCQPPEEVSVRSGCVATARFAYNRAIAAARDEFDLINAAAVAAYNAIIIALNVNKIRKYRQFLLICIVVGGLTGPLGGAICAARAIAQVEALTIAGKIAAKAALELARNNALTALRLALAAACQTLRLGIFACVTCVECPNPDQQPCGDICYNPTSQKCCPDATIVGKDACCPGEQQCPEGCFPEDSCCPEQKRCNGACIPRKDCCDPPTSRRLGEPLEADFMRSVGLQRKLVEDPCCTDPDDPCCGSDDACCGSDDPCCGNDDPCCGSSDPCCGSTSPCCGNPGCGGSSGDPHMTTFDGLRYDCQGRGEFILTKAGDAVVQGRFKKRGRVALTVGGATTEGNGSTEVEVSIPEDGGAPVLVVGGAVISPNSLGFEDNSVIVTTNVRGANSFRITYKTSGLSILAQTFSSYMNVVVGLPQVLLDFGTTGLFGSADNNPLNDWATPDGNILSVPTLRSDLIGVPSLNYCLENWCLKNETDSLFTYYDAADKGYGFAYFSGCDDVARDVVDISNPPPAAMALCGVDEACLVDFVEVGEQVALQTLVETAILTSEFTTGGLVADPANIPIDQSVNVVLSIDTRNSALPEGIGAFSLYRVDPLTGTRLGRTVSSLQDGDGDGIYRATLNQISTVAGEVFGFQAVPVIMGVEEPNSPHTIIRLATIRSFSDESGIANVEEDRTCTEQCNDGNPCTIDFCLNGVCRTESVACGLGESCDPFTGLCEDNENLVPCVAVIDEWNGRDYSREWANFRERFPKRPFCLLVPNNGIQTLPTGFTNDTVNNPDLLDRTIAFTVVRDNSNPSVSSDWFSICGLDQLTPENVPFVGLFVDDSGSMRISTVGTSLSLFENATVEAGFSIRRVVNGSERWIDPFLTDLVPDTVIM